MKKLLPVILLILGAGGGIGAGLFLRPAPIEAGMTLAAACAEGDAGCAEPGAGETGGAANPAAAAAADSAADGSDHMVDAESVSLEYVALQRQMIVPIVSDDQVISLVVLSLSIEVQPGFTTQVYDREPKLRDAFLQVLFRHANSGGFGGDFTSGEKMSDLRRALNGAAQQVLGPVAIQVLVTDILRQET